MKKILKAVVIFSATALAGIVSPGCAGVGSHHPPDAAALELHGMLDAIGSATSVLVSVIGEEDRKQSNISVTGSTLIRLQALLRSTSFEFSPDDTRLMSQDYSVGTLDIIGISIPTTTSVTLIAGRLLVLPSYASFRITPFEKEISTILRDIVRERPTSGSSVFLTRGTPLAGQESRRGSESAEP
jgi:hypothetical protein